MTMKELPITPTRKKPMIKLISSSERFPNTAPTSSPYDQLFLISPKMISVRREEKVVIAEKRTTRRDTPRDVEAKTDGSVRRPPEIVHANTVVVAANRDVGMMKSYRVDLLCTPV